jgi:hypothetical protein
MCHRTSKGRRNERGETSAPTEWERPEYDDVQSRLLLTTKPNEELIQEMDMEPFNRTSQVILDPGQLLVDAYQHSVARTGFWDESV